MRRIASSLVDNNTGQAVPCELLIDMPAELVIDAESKWGPVRTQAAAQLQREGRPIPEHYRWNWLRKSSLLGPLAIKCFGIAAEGRVQGMMMVDTASKHATLPPDSGKPLVYIEYLESAPWNVRDLVPSPRFGAVGTRLIEAAVRYSKEQGFNGRISLHSLPQSESFYRDKLEFTKVGPDPNYEDLTYYELKAQQASLFLKRIP